VDARDPSEMAYCMIRARRNYQEECPSYPEEYQTRMLRCVSCVRQCRGRQSMFRFFAL